MALEFRPTALPFRGGHYSERMGRGSERAPLMQGRLSGPGQRGGVAGARGSVRLCELSKATSQETLEEQRSGASWAGETG